MARIFAFAPGAFNVLTNAPLTASTISRGAPAGITTPCHEPPSKPLRPDSTPDSAMVGTSGRVGRRSRVDTASTRNRPDWTYGSAATAVLNATSMSPETWSISAGPVPLYGTCTMLTPPRRLNISISRCELVPLPPEA